MMHEVTLDNQHLCPVVTRYVRTSCLPARIHYMRTGALVIKFYQTSHRLYPNYHRAQSTFAEINYDPLAELPLLPEPSHIAVPECHLKIVKADDEVLVVEFPIGNNKQAQRQYILADTRFLVEYPFERNYPHDDSSRWRITVVPSLKSGERIHHDFKTREAAFQFQKYLTGYTPDHFLLHSFGTKDRTNIRR